MRRLHRHADGGAYEYDNDEDCVAGRAAPNENLSAAARTASLPDAPPADEGDPTRQPTRSHEHIWQLPDGRGLHAPFGTLVRHPETGEPCCHFCGRWFTALGSHVRVHGCSAEEYRELLGLRRRSALAAPALSTAISARQRARYLASGEVRQRLAVGQDMARSGELNARGRASSQAPRPETVAVQRRTLATGHLAAVERRTAELHRRVSALGASSVEEYMTSAYLSGTSLAALARTTGLGRARVSQVLKDAGLELRPTGVNTAAGKRSRAERAEAVAAARVGTDDIAAWLNKRRNDGATLTELASAVRHSLHWVRWRLTEGEAES